MAKFNPGDVVVLKSGGPDMTVRHIVDSSAALATGLPVGVHVDWLSEGEVQTHWFPEVCLVMRQKKQESHADGA